MTQKKPLKIVFDPGCFDHFDGTQEELDQLVAELTAAAESGDLFEDSRKITEDDWDDLDDDIKAHILRSTDNDKRNLH